MRGTRTAFLVIEAGVIPFRKLILVVLTSGTLAGLALFAVQHFTVIPLIQAAETYETGATHDDEGWQPANGWERTSFTAIATVLSGIALAAMLFGIVALTGKSIDARRGLLWGLAAFACLSVAPALGLPPQPPGTVVAPLHERQLWWAGTAVATAVGLWLIFGQARTWLRIGGLLSMALPHLIGAPVATGQNAIPAQLIRHFTLASVATTGTFWLLLGALGGFLYERFLGPPMTKAEPL